MTRKKKSLTSKASLQEYYASLPPKIRPYAFHGIYDFTERSGDEWVGTCPFCDREGHFYANAVKGVWDCKRCKHTGNRQQFLQELWGYHHAKTGRGMLRSLVQLRGLEIDTLEEAGAAFTDSGWLFPVYDKNGVIVQLRKYTQQGKWLNTAGIVAALYGAEVLSQNTDEPVYVAEGEWDCMAMREILLAGEEEGVVVAVPGAKTWNPKWTTWLADRDVYLLYDNDDAGERGMDKAAKKLAATVGISGKELHRLKWPVGTPPGCDISNLHKDGKLDPEKQIEFVLDNLVEVSTTEAVAEYEEASVLEYTDQGNAIRFARLCGNDLRYCFEHKCWYVWDGTRWCPNETILLNLAKQVAKNIIEESLEMRFEQRDRALNAAIHVAQRYPQESMVSMARSEEGIAIEAKKLNNNPWLLNCLNGTLDLRTGELHEQRRADLITQQAPVVYDAKAKCPLWLKFLDEIMDGNKKMMAFLQRAVGYSLVGEVKEHVLMFLYGTGANGKTTFVNTIKAMLGDYALEAHRALLEVRTHEGSSPEIMALRYKRFVFCAETRKGRHIDESELNRLTGGGEISARDHYKGMTPYWPTHTLWVDGNYKPIVPSQMHGTWRRMKLVPFTIRIPDSKQDKDLEGKLAEELPGILAWAVRGCMKWQKKGLGIPAAVVDATEQYKRDEDRLGAFLDDRCKIGAEYSEEGGKLHTAYMKWCVRNGVEAMSKNGFAKELTERGFGKAKRHGKRFRTGLRLKKRK